MALHLPSSVPKSSFIRRRTNEISSRPNLNKFSVFRVTKFVVAANASTEKIVRRSANYHPPSWKDDYIQSLKSEYQGESFKDRAIKLVGKVKMMLNKLMDPLEKLELVDILQRLGLSFHFENETKRILDSIGANRSNTSWKKDNLYATALEFRLLRQHGYKLTQEVFSSFMDEEENFKAGLSEDYKGLLNLYEASYLSVEDEAILDNARDFAGKHLLQYLKQKKLDQYLSMLVDHALELPLHWRVQRSETRWFIDVYERREDRNPILLELAKLDFNILQAVHQDDLRYASKWWGNIGLGEKLTFSRDRLMGNFLWTLGFASDPQFANVRRNLTKIISLITAIDDVYDVYGTLDELHLFTQAVDRWDINAMELLPEYMKICFLALYNSINEMAFHTLKEQGFDTIPFLKKMWAELCESYLMEAKWYYSGYIPTFKEYIDNARISISTNVALSHAYCLTNDSIKKECLECFKEHSSIIYCSSVIFRLADDLATSSDESKRGDVPKSIQCYMHDTGSSEDGARQHIRKLIDATWKRMNEHLFACSPFSKTFTQIARNMTRTAQYMYQFGDGHGNEYQETKERVSSLLILPIPLQFIP